MVALGVDGVDLLPYFIDCPREILTWRILEEPVGHFFPGSPLGFPTRIPLECGCQFARVKSTDYSRDFQLGFGWGARNYFRIGHHLGTQNASEFCSLYSVSK